MSRPYIQKTVFEMQDPYAASQSNSAELKRLLAELKHRKLPKATALAEKIRKSLDALKQEPAKEQPNASPQEPQSSSAPTHKIIACQKCEQRLRIELLCLSQREQRQQVRALYFRLDQRGLAAIIDAVHGKYVLGEIDSYGDNVHGLPLSWC